MGNRTYGRVSSGIRVAASALALLLASFIAAGDALACGGFFSRAATEGARRPSLAYEQTLIVFDAESRREHFVREVVFRAAREPFGFVVPTPARPEVASVKASPFQALRTDFPFEAAPKGGLRGLGTSGAGIAPGMGGGGVQVLETSKVGSFTAFVLAADNDQALAGWLKKNGFASTPQSDAWLAHYVKLKFFYVAMRYELPKSGASPSTKAETVRISFDTPLPYYPYLEPAAAANEPARAERLLDLWLVSRDVFVPVSAREREGKLEWVRPLASGERYAGSNLSHTLGGEAKLLPAGDLRVLRFMDQKRSRAGFGDIVFVPAAKQSLDPEARARLVSLLPILDPRLLEEK
ncbi:MAG TPA: DUF2330 domain-containing protein [Polyangiaceae bacterium]|nr:DUF2330 domain-containing protein [Polyangiaceae bacterium]